VLSEQSRLPKLEFADSREAELHDTYNHADSGFLHNLDQQIFERCLI